jgi:hypothetical protein
MGFIKSVWARDGLARLDFAWGKAGWGSVFLGKAFPVLAAIVVAFAAWANSQPIFVLILCALAAAVLTLAATWLALATLEKIGTAKKSETPRSKKGSSPQAQGGSGGTLGISMIIAALIVVGGAWAIFNWPTQLQYDQTRLVFNSLPGPPLPDIHQLLGFNIFFNNSGPLEITDYRLQFKFKSVKEELTNKEIDDEFSDISRRLPEKDLFSNSLPVGGSGSYITMQDEKYTPDDWQDVLSGKMMIYMFSTFKYDVGDKTKNSDICLVYNKDYPAVHNCYRNNKTYYDK